MNANIVIRLNQPFLPADGLKRKAFAIACLQEMAEKIRCTQAPFEVGFGLTAFMHTGDENRAEGEMYTLKIEEAAA